MDSVPVVIQTQDVFKSYKVGDQQIQVIKGINFEIHKGDFAVIIGPSGSGKSTLLHMILGLEVPTSGKVYCLDTDLYAMPNEDARSGFRKKHVGMVYQQPNWIKSLSVVENVAFPLSLLGMEKGEAIKKAWHSILQMQMSNWVNYFPTELSGGQQQKIALARALVTDPEIIIADEPTGNLDFESGQELMKLLLKLNDEGKTILMVTHDLEYLKYAKTAVRIFDGKVVESISGEDKKKFEGTINTKRGEKLVAEYETKASFNPMGPAQSSDAKPQETQKPPAPNEPMTKDVAPETNAETQQVVNAPTAETPVAEKAKIIVPKDRKHMFIRKKPEVKTT